MPFRAIFAILLALSLWVPVFARPLRHEGAFARAFPAPPVRARAAVVLDASSGQVLGAYNPHLRLPMASTTKLMTALLAVQFGHLYDRITVPAAAFNYESDATVMGLHPGQVVTLRDLLYGLLLPSGADAANTIAIHYAGSEAHFITLMNQQAQRMGLTDTHYADATGLTSIHHYTSAYDLARLGQDVASIPELLKITSTRYFQWDGHVLQNVNHVLFWYPGVDGLKPGYTYEAGLCQVIDARRDGRHIVVAILNTPDLIYDARNLLNFGLRDFTWVQSASSADSPYLAQHGIDTGGSYAYYPAAGHYLHGKFLDTFVADGGLPALGFPRSEPLTEGRLRVQYFQNGELAQDRNTGKIRRLPLGLTPVPRPAHPAPALPPSATPTPGEGSINPPGSPGTPLVPTPRPSLTPTPVAHAATPTPVRLAYTSAARPFASYLHAHTALLGRAVSPLQWVGQYGVQLFAYGALAINGHSHALYILPIGDRLLAARHYLPPHPGSIYPPGFAPVSVLRALGWVSRAAQ